MSIWFLVHNRYLIQLVKDRRIGEGKRDGGRERGKEKGKEGIEEGKRLVALDL